MRAAAGSLKKVSLELGGKSPNIILADADLEAAIRGASGGVFFNQGEVCSAGSRILVERAIYDPFLEGLHERANTINVGDPLDPDVYMGPVVSDEQFDRVLSYIDIGKGEGAKLVAGGSRIGDKGYFVQPTIFADVNNRMRIARKRSSAPSPPSSPSTTSKRPCTSPTTASTASPPPSGRATSAKRTPSPTACAPAPSG